MNTNKEISPGKSARPEMGAFDYCTSNYNSSPGIFVMKEIWKDVIGYKGYYIVSETGRVKSLNRFVRVGKDHKRFIKGVELNQKTTPHGYKAVTLCKQGMCLSTHVHRIIAGAFIRKIEKGEEVNHINEIKSDNRIVNLEILSKCDHVKLHMKKIRGDKIDGVYKMSICKPVIQYTKDGEFIKEYFSIKSAHIKTGIQASNICCCCKGIKRGAGGFNWKYKNTLQ